jgi:hypothetical protein
MNVLFGRSALLLLSAAWLLAGASAFAAKPQLTLSYKAPHWLIIHGDEIPGEQIRINYLEAYCRSDSTDADWVKHTVVKHQPQFISLSDDQTVLKLRDKVSDGLIVEHTIKARSDEIQFLISAHNPTSQRSEAHWAQPCIRLGDFTGFAGKGGDLDDYLPKCFVFLGGSLMRMTEIKPWAMKARYTPGQVWCPQGVPRTDVNPRPLSSLVPSNGLIGCYSGDDTMIFAVAFEPYQELFQGVARCLHSDFRLGGLRAGERKQIRGRIYLMENDVPRLLKRYESDFPEHQK